MAKYITAKQTVSLMQQGWSLEESRNYKRAIKSYLLSSNMICSNNCLTIDCRINSSGGDI